MKEPKLTKENISCYITDCIKDCSSKEFQERLKA